MLIKYTDDEVKIFHPICNKALREALIQLNLNDDYEVKHHYSIDGIIPDFVIINKNTGKILLVIEVKRTRSQVMSTRYRLQAQSYISNTPSVKFERKYFMLTNLEQSYLFKYNNQDTSVINQIIDPSPFNTGELSDSSDVFMEKLIDNFTMIIKIVVDDSGEYQLNYNRVLEILNSYTNDEENWHSAITLVGYELIKNVIGSYRPELVEGWGDAISYYRTPSVIQRLVNTIDFDTLGQDNIINDPAMPYWTSSFLRDASELGNRTYSADEFASAAHEILVKGNEGDGIVPTDMELALVLAKLVTSELKKPETAVYCDPASGSGNLLSAIIDLYPSISPTSIWANDVFIYFKEILSIRFGLKFPNVISPDNAPRITSKDISDLDQIDFQSVDAIVINPPYVSGVKDQKRKKVIFERITEITRKNAITNIGQMPLEGPFLELVIKLTKIGTIYGVIFPEQHLFGKGNESKTIRKMLLGEFGLKKIVTYPRTGLFEEVTKGTVILIGEKGAHYENIEIINCAIPIEEIDINNLTGHSSSPGIKIKVVSYEELLNSIDYGWKLSMYPIFNTIFAKLSTNLIPLPRNMYRRGPADNSKEGKYLFITKQRYWKDVMKIVPRSWLKPGIQRTIDYEKNGPLIHSDESVRALCPPDEAFEKDTPENKKLLTILNIAYCYLKKNVSKGSQARPPLTPEEVLPILNKARGKAVPAGKILLPRALREEFKVFVTTEDTIVGTNFMVLNVNPEEVDTYISWFTSIFGQIQLEMLSKPQEGLRKSELRELGLMKFPANISELSKTAEIPVTYNREFVDFVNENNIDEYWKRELNISEKDYIALLNLMSKLIALRNP